MSFEDLPQNWTHLPLSTPGLAVDVVDLVLRESMRAEDTLLLLPCDEHDIAYPSPIAIAEVEWSAPEEERREILAALAGIGVPSVAVAVSSSHRLPDELVRRWHSDVESAFSAAGTRLIGFFCGWPFSVEQVELEPAGSSPDPWAA
ncbi:MULTISPECIES: hypothetical protein [Nesterenkonia]|uniref:Uncharacterized protein n=1 Tax=Nesterenkonia xinjiangensis TaxID=225327 RepID=A0A7Z0GJY2_9MICC|nr:MULTISPECIES: hypothetical protein [Nesterenkonia]MDZ5078787.1 hypothetical protein [Nesterenkonia sp. HG001]NYJ76809.1 hypothetical protein [Nesterenkonia xinjiangensis]